MPPVAPSLRPLDDLGDLAGLEAPRANAQALDCPTDHGPQGGEVGQPPSIRYIVGVADLMADGRPFPADIAPLSHADSLEVNVVRRRRGSL